MAIVYRMVFMVVFIIVMLKINKKPCSQCFKELQGRHPLSVWILAFEKLYIAGIFLYGYCGKQAKGK